MPGRVIRQADSDAPGAGGAGNLRLAREDALIMLLRSQIAFCDLDQILQTCV
jgi:hypothetical protein